MKTAIKNICLAAALTGKAVLLAAVATGAALPARGDDSAFARSA